MATLVAIVMTVMYQGAACMVERCAYLMAPGLPTSRRDSAVCPAWYA